MSWIKFELKKEHVSLIKALEWDERIKYLHSTDENNSPFGGTNLIEDLGFIIYGKPQTPFDPASEVSAIYTPDEVSNMLSLFHDLPTALELTSYLESFELGKYKRRFRKKDWTLQKEKKING